MSKKNYAVISDRSDEVPELKPYLRPGEKVTNIERCPAPNINHLPDYREELCRLCSVDRTEDIGRNGPAVAALAIQESKYQGLFAHRFGRDGLVAANDLMPEFPLLTRTTLLDFASLIGSSKNQGREEEFGRMFHEARQPDDPIARKVTLERGWGWPFYAAVDATPLFVKTLYNYVANSPEGVAFLDESYTGRDEQRHCMWDALRYSMMWIVKRINHNPERFLEYKPAFESSLHNQVMEDSWDSHFHSDGSLADFTRGVCSTEVQGLAYDALLMAAELLEKQPVFRQEAAEYCKFAPMIRLSVLKHLVVKDERGLYLAVGADRDERGQVRVMKVRKAMPNGILSSRMFADKNNHENRLIPEACAKTIFEPSLLCAAGVRSLASDERRFMPGAYHNGSSWPMQTFTLAEGLRLQGFYTLADNLDRRIVNVMESTKQYPEYAIGGTLPNIQLNERVVDTYDSLDQRENRREQPPQQVQLWSLSAYAAIMFRKHHGFPRPQAIEEKILEDL